MSIGSVAVRPSVGWSAFTMGMVAPPMLTTWPWLRRVYVALAPSVGLNAARASAVRPVARNSASCARDIDRFVPSASATASAIVSGCDASRPWMSLRSGELSSGRSARGRETAGAGSGACIAVGGGVSGSCVTPGAGGRVCAVVACARPGPAAPASAHAAAAIEAACAIVLTCGTIRAPNLPLTGLHSAGRRNGILLHCSLVRFRLGRPRSCRANAGPYVCVRPIYGIVQAFVRIRLGPHVERAEIRAEHHLRKRIGGHVVADFALLLRVRDKAAHRLDSAAPHPDVRLPDLRVGEREREKGARQVLLLVAPSGALVHQPDDLAPERTAFARRISRRHPTGSRSLRRPLRLERLGQHAKLNVEMVAYYRVFIAEVVEERAFPNVGRLGDHFNRHRVVLDLREEPDRGAIEPLARLCSASIAAR